MKRFFDHASASAEAHGFSIQLDGKPIKTPAGSPLVVENAGLADAIAEEWDQSGKTIDATKLHLTQLANTALDRGAGNREVLLDEIAQYLDGDTLLYRSDDDFVAPKQVQRWDPVVEGCETAYGINLTRQIGIMPVAQDALAHQALRSGFEVLDDFALIAALSLIRSMASVLLVDACLLRLVLPFEEAWHLSRLEMALQEEKWGIDPEAAALDALKYQDAKAAYRFFHLCQS